MYLKNYLEREVLTLSRLFFCSKMLLSLRYHLDLRGIHIGPHPMHVCVRDFLKGG